MHKKIALFALFLLLTAPFSAKAADFDPSYVISDADMTDYDSMTLADIGNFLKQRAGTLATYLTFDKEGLPKTATQAFYEIAQKWQINPKYLMLLTQKEQSLLEDSSPTQKQYDWATGYGVCDSCSMSDETIQKFKGFYRQVNSAAAQTRYYMDNISEFTYQPNKTYTIDSTRVTIKNTATAGLYNYTPHLHGNENMWNLWNKYFSQSWPDGSLLTTEDSDNVYYIENGAKRLIVSKAVFASRFNSKSVLTVSSTVIDSYSSGPDIKYVNFSLLQSSSTGNIYMIVNDTKRKFTTSTLLKKFGFNSDDVETVPETELLTYADGADITEYTNYPTGVILQDSKAKTAYDKMYYVISGEKKPITNKEIFSANFSGMTVKKVSTAELDKYMAGDSVYLPDGWLVKTKKSPAVYVISHGQRLVIPSSAVFKAMHYDSKNIKIISEETMQLHPLGAVLTVN